MGQNNYRIKLKYKTKNIQNQNQRNSLHKFTKIV
jgi:hypothetical protein